MTVIFNVLWRIININYYNIFNMNSNSYINMTPIIEL
jgi:hypothetical protein